MHYLNDLLDLYAQATTEREAQTVRSIIKKDLLNPFLAARGLTSLQSYNFKQILHEVSVGDFLSTVEPLLAEIFSSQLKTRTLSVKKSKIKRFLTWSKGVYVEDTHEDHVESQKHFDKGLYGEVEALKKRRERRDRGSSSLSKNLTPTLKQEFQDFDKFCLTTTQWRTKPVRTVTLENFHKKMQSLLEFQAQQGIPCEQLSLKLLLERTAIKDYAEWARKRGLASQTIKSCLSVLPSLAQWVFSCNYPSENWQNPEFVKTIRSFLKEFTVDYKDRPLTSQQAFEEREISREQCWEILKYLGWRCKDLEKQLGVTKTVVDAWQDYLILAILITAGPRQREVRELTLQKISQEPNGDLIVTLSPEDHKTGSKTDRGREYVLFVGPLQQELTADLSYYCNFIRPKNLNHNYLFFLRRGRSLNGEHSRRGDPIKNAIYLSDRVSHLVAMVTTHLYGESKWTAPHDFRRIIATWVCTYGGPEHLAIYAEMLGHALEELVTRYNKMHVGKLARQAPLAYQAIAAKEARVKFWQNPEQTNLSFDEMDETLKIKLYKKVVRKLWNSLTPRRRVLLLESLSLQEKACLED